jgi:hypothetical protein
MIFIFKISYHLQSFGAEAETIALTGAGRHRISYLRFFSTYTVGWADTDIRTRTKVLLGFVTYAFQK